MIKINLKRDKQGCIEQFVVKGHAGYAKLGSDIICAAVSAIAFTAAGALGDLAGIMKCYTERDGYMRCSIPEDISYEQKRIAAIILETTAIGFKQIEMQYKEYVSVLDEEV